MCSLHGGPRSVVAALSFHTFSVAQGSSPIVFQISLAETNALNRDKARPEVCTSLNFKAHRERRLYEDRILPRLAEALPMIAMHP